ncbi:MAG: glycosyltransferase [Blastocatellia bacterium]|nr:glycosyltransferase [Blastocatellia bacterium]MCS7157460.1 glycosyltransferase [Blastocatellia bacterium]MCX7752633.1 glycosyltransferase [Blastocatellia bacterium]MDW8168364.1 glycosyltransferase [Acidobacteriota bacterium]MDW8255560.1 glycosyltransferase [Acidobacteriota bacterium]
MRNTADARPIVAEVKPEYLPLTETFIYEYLRALRRVRPVVVAEEVKHLDLFPVKELVRVRTLELTLRERMRDRLLAILLRFENARAYRYHAALRRLHPQLVHAHFGPTGVLVLAAARRLGVPLITSFYGYDLSALARDPAWRARYRHLFAHGALFLVEGPHMRERLIRLGCPPEKIRVRRIAIDLDEFPFRPRVWREGPLRLLQVGRLVEKKGHEYALRAFAHVRSRARESEFYIIGDGPLRPHLERLAGELGIAGAVHWLGPLSRAAYREVAERCHILVQPSVVAANGDDEGGAPTVLLEMQASGMPIVATRHADIPYVVREGESARLVPERDVAALADALLELIENPARWPSMAEAGRTFVAEHHDIRREAPRLEALYWSVIEASRATTRSSNVS